MPTINQLVRKGRKAKKTKTKAPALQYTLNAYSQKRTRRRKGARARNQVPYVPLSHGAKNAMLLRG